jgi:hypothetical protein
MASMADTVEQAGRRLGLQVRPGRKTAFGAKDGYLVQLVRGQDGSRQFVTEIIRHGDTRPLGIVRQAIQASPELAAGGIKPKKLDVSAGMVVYKHTRPMFRGLGPEAVAREADALLRAVKRACPVMPEACRLCGSASGSEPILLNEVVDRVCPACLERLQHEVKRAREQYESRHFNLPLAVLTAAALALVGALVWAGLAVATRRVFWAVAIGSGILIGWGTTKAAGKGGPATQSLVALFTVASVLLGQLFTLAYHVDRIAKARGGAVIWTAFAAAIPRLLWNMGGDTLFALGGGLLGAYYAARRAGRPSLDVKVERG